MFAKLYWFLGYLGSSFSLLTAHSFARARESLGLLVDGVVCLIGQPTQSLSKLKKALTAWLNLLKLSTLVGARVLFCLARH